MKQLRYWGYLIIPCAALGWLTSWGVGVALGVGVLIGICVGVYSWQVGTNGVLARSGLIMTTENGKAMFVPKAEAVAKAFETLKDTAGGSL